MAEEVKSTADTGEPKYLKEALLLAQTYTKLLEERTRLRELLAGSWVYTKSMAISELDNITVSYEGERVQSSNISNPTERIALKLTEEYMARKQREMDTERDACAAELEYVEWKIQVVETVMAERMNDTQRAVFTLIFIGHKTYKEAEKIIRKKRKQTLVNRNIAEIKTQIWELLMRELMLQSNFVEHQDYLKRLTEETEEEHNA